MPELRLRTGAAAGKGGDGCDFPATPHGETEHRGADDHGVGRRLGDGACAGVVEREVAAALADRPSAG